MADSIYVPGIGLYPSIAAASKALGVDSSNIGKVLRGARKSAGGYNFLRVAPDVGAGLLRDIDEAIEESLTDTQRRQQARRRKAGKSRLSEEERARQRAKRQLARELSKELVQINRDIKRLQKEGVAGLSSAVGELEQLKNIIGRNKIGGFDTSLKNLSKMDADTLQAVREAINKQTSRKSYADVEALKQRRAALALQLGISQEQLDDYNDVLPILWELLAKARYTQGANYDREIYDDVREAMQDGADPETLREILEGLRGEYQGRDITAAEMKDILQAGTDTIEQIARATPPEGSAAEGAYDYDDLEALGFIELPT